MTQSPTLNEGNRVAIIGAGFSGIAAATALVRRGIEDFVIFESASGVGGTWWHNRYPGAAVDLESHLYSFSFEQYDWSRTHAEWHEILEYLQYVAKKWDLERRIKLNERVDRVEWDDRTSTYTVTTASRSDHKKFDAVISCVGFLNIPLLPPFVRHEHSFRGPVCHTSRWPEDLSLAGKRVGVVGTGSSGVQIVGSAEKEAKSVTIFQLEPNWIVPKGARDLTEEERERYRNPDVYFAERQRLYDEYERMQRGGSHARRDGVANQARAKLAREFMNRELGDRPDLLELVTPDFAFESRRTVNSDDYYQSIRNPKVSIIPSGAKRFSTNGIVDGDEVEHELDVVVLATGFDAANYLGGITVRGREGRDLHEFWDGEPAAYLGMMVPGFPNFFMLYGPNTNSIPLVTFYEAQAKFAAEAIAERTMRRAKTVEIPTLEYERFNDWLQRRLDHTVWGEVRNYFQSQSGKIVSQWPDSPGAYMELVEEAQNNTLEFGGERSDSLVP